VHGCAVERYVEKSCVFSSGKPFTLVTASFDQIQEHLSVIAIRIGLSTPERKCIGWPEQKYISDASRKAVETGVFCSGIRLGSDYLPAYPS
jgi:hypothetical protein